jgi:hypothetical protein
VGWALLGLGLVGPAYYRARAALPEPSVNVRWTPQTDGTQRAELEARFGLLGGEPADSTTWRYRLGNTSRANIAALVSHPRVADTHKINRSTFEVEDEVSPAAVLIEVVPVAFGWSLIVCLALYVGARGWSGAVRLWPRARSALHRLASTARDGLAHAVERGADRHPTIATWETVVDVAVGLCFLAPLLVRGPWDDEESGLGFFSSQLFYRDLVRGHWSFWTNNLGFGTVLPIGQRFDFHPVFAVGSLVSLRAALSLAWLLHVTLMTVYFRRLASTLGMGPLVRTALTACYLFSLPSINYFHATDWLSHVVGWSLYPLLTYHVHRMVTGTSGGHPLADTLRLALLGSLWVLNSHLGYIAPLALVLGFYTLLLAASRPAVYKLLLAAAALCAVACAERLYFFVSEAALFPQSVPRVTQDGYSLLSYLWTAAVPFVRLSDGARQPFIGLVAGVAAFVSLRHRSAIPGTRAVGLAFLLSLVLSLMPVRIMAPLKIFSGVWFF